MTPYTIRATPVLFKPLSRRATPVVLKPLSTSKAVVLKPVSRFKAIETLGGSWPWWVAR
jgi:hypothetical protein